MSWKCRSCLRAVGGPSAPRPLRPGRVYCSFKTVHNALRCPTSNAQYLPAGVLKRGEGQFPQRPQNTSAQTLDGLKVSDHNTAVVCFVGHVRSLESCVAFSVVPQRNVTLSQLVWSDSPGDGERRGNAPTAELTSFTSGFAFVNFSRDKEPLEPDRVCAVEVREERR